MLPVYHGKIITNKFKEAGADNRFGNNNASNFKQEQWKPLDQLNHVNVYYQISLLKTIRLYTQVILSTPKNLHDFCFYPG